MKKFPFYKQLDQKDCGPTCLRMICKFHGKTISLNKLRELCLIHKQGVSLLGISNAAEHIGLRSTGAKIRLDQLIDAELPCILHWRQNHFVVLYKISKSNFYIADPAVGLMKYSIDEFTGNWLSKKQLHDGIALFLHTTPQFHNLNDDSLGNGLNWSILLSYRHAYKKLILQLILGLAIASCLQLISPFLTQAIVDIGINTKNLDFINLILIAQIALFIGSMSVGFIRSWIMLHMTTRINVSILSDYLAKIMRLPLSFFETRSTGDIMQRMADHKRIESFLTGATINTLFSMLNLLVYAVIVAYYNTTILLIFLSSTVLYTIWILIFMSRRRELDEKRFDNSSRNQNHLVELIDGIQEIKLHNSEQQKRWQWESIQASIFKYSTKSLALNQYQQAGSSFINQVKNILITFVSAKLVIEGDLTLGGMMALQFMAGQLNVPIEQLLGLIQGFQDANISLERLNEVHKMDDEESSNKQWNYILPENKSLSFSNVTFKYPVAGGESILKDINMLIPEGKTTAIVGVSGSGKTTILKLLLRFYEIEKGEIKVGENNLNQYSFQEWRNQCGTVMQDGFIFSDTILRNIAVTDERPDLKKLNNAIKIANVEEFINKLPLGLNTKIGISGQGISQGQKQRLLIARAVYKNPHYIFFDEATNSLDTNNERLIMNNLYDFFIGRTVVIVAHRLSTVKNADNIVVLDKGCIVEKGSHQDLINLKGKYYNLIQNQLNLEQI